MAGSVNKVILVGNLGRDPEVRRLGNGEPVVNLRVATSESWKDKGTGERKEKTEWHSVVIFNENLGRVAEQYLKKGSKVYLEGQLQTRKWTDQSGAEKYTTEVVLQRFRGELTILDSRGGGSADPRIRNRLASPRPLSAGPRPPAPPVTAGSTTRSRSDDRKKPVAAKERSVRRGMRDDPGPMAAAEAISVIVSRLCGTAFPLLARPLRALSFAKLP